MRCSERLRAVTACAADHADPPTTGPLTAPSAPQPTLAAFARTGCASPPPSLSLGSFGINKNTMKTILATFVLVTAAIIPSVEGAIYVPTPKVGEFLRQFEKAYRSGDQEWIQSAVDKEGVIEEAKAIFFGFLGPKNDGEAIYDLKVIAAPEDYKPPNSLLDTEIDPTIPVDFIITFKRMVGGLETTIKVPVGYRDGMIWLSGVKKR